MELGDSEFAPLSSRAAVDNLAAQVDDAVSKGAVLHAGGELADGPAAYYAPAVLTGVTPEMRPYREELFGPVAVVYRVDSDEEALRRGDPHGGRGTWVCGRPRLQETARKGGPPADTGWLAGIALA
jgi:acyl-CoA reductase-like NAD-dependent aldehyde dehydrogenase